VFFHFCNVLRNRSNCRIYCLNYLFSVNILFFIFSRNIAMSKDVKEATYTIELIRVFDKLFKLLSFLGYKAYTYELASFRHLYVFVFIKRCKTKNLHC